MELNKINLDSAYSNTVVPEGQRFLFLGYKDGDESKEVVIRYKDSNGNYGNIASGQNVDDENNSGYIEVSSIENGKIVFSTSSFPVFIKTSNGNFYPIEKQTLTQIENNFYVEVEPYLAYDNVTEFNGTWVIYLAGGTKGDIGKLNIVVSNTEPKNPVEGMIWVPGL